VFTRFDPATANGAAPASAAFYARAAIPARYDLERRDWAHAARSSLCRAASLFRLDHVVRPGSRRGAPERRRRCAGRDRALDQIHDTLAGQGEDYWAQQTDIQRRAVAAILAFAEGHVPEALAGMRAAADLEDSTQLASVTPGALAPAREMLGEMLLAQSRPAEALEAFEASLVQEPNRFWSLYGAAEAAKQAGDAAKAHGTSNSLWRWPGMPISPATGADEARRETGQ
jgi:tetratricopeptide (TPR) repeat protein